MIANTAQRPSWRVWPLGGVGRPQRVGDLDGDLAVVQALGAFRSLGVGASSPAPRVRRSTRLPDVWMPRSASRARILRWPSLTNGDCASSQRTAARARDRPSRRPAQAGG